MTPVPDDTPSEVEAEAFESGYARISSDGSVYASPSESSEVLGVLARDAVVYVVERVSDRWVKAVFACEQLIEQTAEGYLREDTLIPEADQTAAVSAIEAGRHVACAAYGGVILPLVDFVGILAEAGEGGDRAAAEEMHENHVLRLEEALPAGDAEEASDLPPGASEKDDAYNAASNEQALFYDPPEGEAAASLTDEKTKVIIEGVPAGVTVSVAVVETDTQALETALKEAGLTLIDAVCYDIILWQNESEYQPQTCCPSPCRYRRALRAKSARGISPAARSSTWTAAQGMADLPLKRRISADMRWSTPFMTARPSMSPPGRTVPS